MPFNTASPNLSLMQVCTRKLHPTCSQEWRSTLVVGTALKGALMKMTNQKIEHAQHWMESYCISPPRSDTGLCRQKAVAKNNQNACRAGNLIYATLSPFESKNDFAWEIFAIYAIERQD
ncbi:MAG: hypothetical protein ACE5IY_10315 [bacterium]